MLEGERHNGSLQQRCSPADGDPDGKHKNRPKDTRVRQQKLDAWQPIPTASTVIPTIFLVGIVFMVIGVFLLLASNSVREIVVDYTLCEPPSTCEIKIAVQEPFEGNVYFYYGLDNYYQNHRRYMKSRNDAQLSGNLDKVEDCEPYAYANSSSGQKVIAPCGVIANSMFNDTFVLSRTDDGSEVPWTHKGVVWPIDKERKFQNPPGGSLQEAFMNTVKPPNWGRAVWQLSDEPGNNGFINTDFIVWMRTAALPRFRKLYRVLVRDDRTKPAYANGLPAGNYTLKINCRYPVTVFGGRKLFSISTTSWAGGKNSFLGIAYIVVSCICIILGSVFVVIHKRIGTSSAMMNSVALNVQ